MIIIPSSTTTKLNTRTARTTTTTASTTAVATTHTWIKNNSYNNSYSNIHYYYKNTFLNIHKILHRTSKAALLVTATASAAYSLIASHRAAAATLSTTTSLAFSNSFPKERRLFSTTTIHKNRIFGSTTTTTTHPTSNKNTLPSSPHSTTTTMSMSKFSSTTEQTYPTEMSEAERYLFDLNGFLIVRNVLTPSEIKAANEAIDAHSSRMIERSDDALRNAVDGTHMYGNGPGRKDLGGVLEWGPQDSKVFRSVLAHPRLVPLFHGILGKGYRMDHLPFIIAQDRGAEGFQLHGGTVDCATGQYNPYLAYACHQNTIHTSLLGVNVMLVDHDAGAGGFCAIPGSHKSNFACPPGMIDGESHSEYVVQPVTRAGDVVLFSEGTVHGAMPWNREYQRRTCLYRFAPSTNVYGRSYFGSHDLSGYREKEEEEKDSNHVVTATATTTPTTTTTSSSSSSSDNNTMGWPEKMYEGNLTDAQRAVLEPPYANRLDRPLIKDPIEGTVEVESRSERKKRHDRELFGTHYF